jgi:uncharacterized membrane protein YdjX (TVP38/TMEM64 family)
VNPEVGGMEKETLPRRRWQWGRWVPLAVLVALMVLVLALGPQRYLTLEMVGRHYDLLKQFIEGHRVTALLLYTALYVAVVALSLPCGLLMTLSGGLLFGWAAGAIASVIGATLGATIVFLIAGTSVGEALAKCATPWLDRLRQGFRQNALSYMLFLRLVPAFPFFVVNLAPALLGVPLGTYVLGTALGIIPATLAFSATGAGLASVIEAQNRMHAACVAEKGALADSACPYTIDASALVTPEMLIGLALLGVLALLPVGLKKWSKRDAAP